ncbi:MAG: hypothetical protein RLZ40_1088 [Actinomycetota bacterium]
MRLGVSWCSTSEGSLVDVQVEAETQFQEQPALDNTRRHAGRTDRTKEDGIKRAKRLESLVAQHFAVAQVSRTTEVKKRGVELDTCGAHHLERFGKHLGADAVAANHCHAMRRGA